MNKYLAMLAYLMLYDYAFNRVQRDMVLTEIIEALDQELPDGVSGFVNWAHQLQQQREAAIEAWRKEHRSESAQQETPFRQWQKQRRAKVLVKTGADTKDQT